MTSQECEVCNQYNSDILQGKVRRLWVPGRIIVFLLAR
ncbi:hypothetical protein AYX15_07041 [Cryptococcus neoformans]|nr:hypothetical protein AYX15_07041 [Cryptococcus neoformans var. grubii]